MSKQDKIELIWLIVTDWNRCCSCCGGDDSYREMIDEIGKVIDGRKWDGKSRSVGD